MNSYSYLAKVYDVLMEDVDYEKWSSYLHKILLEAGTEKLLEMSCGTGNVTFPLSRLGYNIVAADSSVEMLSLAKQKNARACAGVRFVHQDMRKIDSTIKYDAVVSACDGVNYIDKYGLGMFISSSYNALKAGGMLLFDISSEYKLKNTLDGNSYFDETDDIVCIWKNTYDEDKSALNMDVTIFSRQGELYERMNEVHTQFAHREQDVVDTAKQAGFAEVLVYECLTFDKPRAQTQRLQFVCRKI